jgi:RNA polymerase sigma factor (sigma-70 family)
MLEEIVPIIEGCLTGDEDAWRRFVHACSGIANSKIAGLSSSFTQVDREDIIQNVFARLSKYGLAKFRGVSPYQFLSYFNTIVRNEVFRYANTAARRSTDSIDNGSNVGDDDAPFDVPDPEICARPDKRAESQELLDCIAREMKECPTVDLQVLMLKIKGRKEKDISAILKIPPGTVAVKYSRIKAKLREKCCD